MSVWCSGYHIRLTRGRSSVQSRPLICCTFKYHDYCKTAKMQPRFQKVLVGFIFGRKRVKKKNALVSLSTIHTKRYFSKIHCCLWYFWPKIRDTSVWCSGYHIRLTRGRPSVQSRPLIWCAFAPHNLIKTALASVIGWATLEVLINFFLHAAVGGMFLGKSSLNFFWKIKTLASQRNAWRKGALNN